MLLVPLEHKIFASAVVFQAQVELRWKDAEKVKMDKAQNYNQNLVCCSPLT